MSYQSTPEEEERGGEGEEEKKEKKNKRITILKPLWKNVEMCE